MTHLSPITVFFFILSFFICNSAITQSAIHGVNAIHHPILAYDGMVATQHHEASKVGIEILKKGGNAIDAAVAVGFSLAVVLPRAGNLGGGGFMLVHLAEEEKTIALNYREIAPFKSKQDMYLDKNGEVDVDLFNQSYHSVGVPGSVAGLIGALEDYGTLTLEEVIAPAIRLAKEGFVITHDLEKILIKYENRLRKCPNASKIFYPSPNTFYKMGDLLIQKDLAWSLEQISREGKEAFYKGAIAKKLVADMKNNGGLINKKDLKKYQVTKVKPILGTYRDYEIQSMPPPSSGGVHLIQILNILEDYDLKNMGHNTAECIHHMVEAMRLAYADRSKHLGDPAFVEVPAQGIISKEYAKLLRNKINADVANKSEDILAGEPKDFESEETTHFSVADNKGNVVSNTYTLNFSFGSGYVAKGTGILLNNEMGDFAAKPGAIDAYGLVGGKANAVEAGKRPLSSMTPTIVLKDGKPYLITGSPGGSRIITTVLQTILNTIDHGMNVSDASHAIRIHHQWYPDVLFHEAALNADTKNLLKNKGHNLEVRAAMGSTQSIMIVDGIFLGASDPRRPDAKCIGF